MPSISSRLSVWILPACVLSVRRDASDSGTIVNFTVFGSDANTYGDSLLEHNIGTDKYSFLNVLHPNIYSKENMLMAVSSVVFLCFALGVCWQESYNESSKGSWHRLDGRSCIVASALISDMLKSMEYTIMVPISLDLIQAIGFGPIVSGIFLSCLQVCVTIGSTLCWMFADQTGPLELRRIVICCLLGIAVTNFAFAWLVTSSSFGGIWLLAGMMVLRSLVGVMVGAIDFSFQRICVHCLLPQERADYFLARPAFVVTGYGMGPMLSGAVMWFHRKAHVDNSSVFLAASLPLVVISLVFGVLAYLTCLIPPHIWGTKRPEVSQERNTKNEPSNQHNLMTCDHLSTENRKNVMMFTYLFQFERSFTVVAVEVSSAFILEVEFGWSPQSIGFAMGTVLVVSVIMGCVVIARGRRQMHDVVMVSILCTFTVIGAILLFTFVGIFTPYHPEIMVLVADAILYSCASGLTGIIEGFACNAAVPGTSFSVENFLMVKGVIANGARTLSAPCSRGVIAYVNRDVYAGMQLGLTLLTAGSCWKIASLASQGSSSSSTAKLTQ